ncbi:ATP-dependent Clp protease ATP-binding subunit ClpA [Clostridium acetobutylicum]|uniref:ATPase with chaperon activity, two ATP-binding domains, ClpC orthologs n=1 Tax=Clostridium acetobutylicum (strain ATCC 824 / DSM 792 / JCM 1419 / IAM 19013 / LMG 5710 / NBRC 13948 / NRRL B-527 / VKM B-1787 / 2291 / W) TaxID=272562 RepID=Q97KL3_CLOAB|nr:MULTISPECIES: ATP-dependent Clp protease ATP-binding subunit [Clostridium]AAK78880.1 ATPase with chaperon activity, two ATP-binding domains, ClpC orthologs [Clostridium acetobutylicum ATCC 824]ADZ19955.1 ATPase with chaperon activity, two ATP-binding domains [Clostridium acetobutylicum EA 2018]AEI31496.1 ABC transporter ATPase [Clostridium acetobutylicum DSM 1731]AWV80599.1 ATP-dependent Clp protease ATP-binding subunit [Clostridium acetobutylicum]MBC2392789.1 ATP-dependent Clp protease ATP
MVTCSVCKKNVAVIFTNKVIDGKQELVGLCLPCAKKLGISPLTQIIDTKDMKEDDFQNLSSQMNDMLKNIDLDKVSDESGNGGGLLNFFNNAFNNSEQPENKNSEYNNTKNDKTHKKNKKKKYLDSYGINLTLKAKNGEIDTVIGREREVDRLIQILNRRTKNNPILIGEAGVGKTAIAEGFAVRIAEKNVPARFLDTEVYMLELNSIVAGTQFRGQFEARMKGIIDEINQFKNVILIIDEIHNIIGAGNAESGSLSAANILKPALAKGELQLIGATTIEEYRKYIEKDSALERRFQPIMVEEPTIEQTIEIVKGIKSYYEIYHKITIPDDVIESAVRLSGRYISDRFFPDKAIDVIDEAGSRANLKNKGLVELEALKTELSNIQNEITKCAESNDFEKAAEYKVEECKVQTKIDNFSKEYSNVVLTLDDVASVVESWTKIPVQKITEIEAEKLLNLEERLHKRVIGQNEAVSSVARTIRRNRSGFKKLKKPSSFIFVGPTGVGKTELVKTLASELFQNEKALIRVDMSEYMEKHTVSKLIGAPPGYVGYDNGGQLTEKVRRNPYSVILLDEIEKAHPDVFNILLQILEDGRLTDSQGRTVNFENTIIIMTSNAGTNLKSSGIGFSRDDYSSLSGKIKDVLRETFRPEFLNRIDETIIFTELNKDELMKIIDLMLKEIINEGKDKDIAIEISEDVKDFIFSNGYDKKYGARPLRRTIQKYIEDELAEFYIKGIYKEGSKVRIYIQDEKIAFE